jgi:uncharacterized protein YecA (UPF0149 family)
MNFFKKIINKIIGEKTSQQKHKEKPIQIPKTKEKESETPSQKEEKNRDIEIKEISDEEIIAEINSLAPGILSQAKTPEMKKIIIEMYRKMLEDGVNVQNEKEVEKWMQKNQDLFIQPSQKIETYRREKPKVGRNDPCPCGSGKKYKKCCGAKE